MASAAGATQPQADNGVVQASPSNPPPLLLDNPGISDENDFGAVGERRSIETDAQRLEQAKANYKVIEPTALPSRVSTGPNIVAYALETKNPRGTKIYNRVGLTSQSRYEKNCAKYRSNDQAQTAFLTKGGPTIDRLGLDPDGDGFACGWDPSPFRKAAGG